MLGSEDRWVTVGEFGDAGESFATKSVELMEHYGMWVAVGLDPTATSAHQGTAAPSAATGCLPPASSTLGDGRSLGQLLDRDAYRRIQEENAQRAAVVKPRAAVGKPQRTLPASDSARTTAEPARRRRPQPRAGANDPLVVYDDKTRISQDGSTGELDRAAEPIAAPLYVRVAVALGGTKTPAEEKAAPRSTELRVSGLSADLEGAESATSNALNASTHDSQQPSHAALAIPLLATGVMNLSADHCQPDASQSQRDPGAASRLPEPTLCPDIDCLREVSAAPLRQHGALPSCSQPSASDGTTIACGPVLATPPVQCAVLSGMGTADSIADLSLGVPADAANSIQEPVYAQLGIHEKVEQPWVPASAEAAASSCPHGSAAAIGSVSIRTETGKQAAYVTLDNKRNRKRRKRISGTAIPTGVLLQSTTTGSQAGPYRTINPHQAFSPRLILLLEYQGNLGHHLSNLASISEYTE